MCRLAFKSHRKNGTGLKPRGHTRGSKGGLMDRAVSMPSGLQGDMGRSEPSAEGTQ